MENDKTYDYLCKNGGLNIERETALLKELSAELRKVARYEAVVKAADELFPLNVKELPEGDPKRTDRMHALWAAVRELRGNRGQHDALLQRE